MLGRIRYKENYPGTIFRKTGPSPVIAMFLGRTVLKKNHTGKTLLPSIYVVKHAYKGTIGDRYFSVAGSLRFIQVLVIWITGIRSPRDCKYFPLNSGFRCAQVLFKKSSYVCVCVCVRVYVYVYRFIHSQA